MNTDIETFGSPVDPIYARQKEDVAKMRASLLACSGDTLSSPITKQALKNITAMRIYHQISRIIRYLDLMDKLEDKLYASIEATIDRANEDSTSTWVVLLNIQEKLQKSMIESHKLLQPYMELQDIQLMDLIPEQESLETASNIILPADSREKIRNVASEVLQSLEEDSGGEDSGNI